MVCSFCKKCPKCVVIKQKASHNVSTCLTLKLLVRVVIAAKAAKLSMDSFKEACVEAAGTMATAAAADACGASGVASIAAAGGLVVGGLYQLYGGICTALDIKKLVGMKKSEQAKYVLSIGLLREMGPGWEGVAEAAHENWSEISKTLPS